MSFGAFDLVSSITALATSSPPCDKRPPDSLIISDNCPPFPPIPEDDDITLTLSTTGNIEYEQFNPTASLKLLTGDRLPELKMTLVDSYGSTLHTDKPIYYECEIRSSITIE